MHHRILLQGRPGIGKTTAIRGAVRDLRSEGVTISGFVTDEIRASGHRVGFAVTSFDGATAVMAHVDRPGPLRVGRYGLDLAAFESVALPALSPPWPGVVVIDELGPMELRSDSFITAVVGVFEEEQVPVLASVHAGRHPFTDLLIGRGDTIVVDIRAENRDLIPAMVIDSLKGGPALGR